LITACAFVLVFDIAGGHRSIIHLLSPIHAQITDVSGTVRIWDTTQKEHILKIELKVLAGPILDIQVDHALLHSRTRTLSRPTHSNSISCSHLSLFLFAFSGLMTAKELLLWVTARNASVLSSCSTLALLLVKLVVMVCEQPPFLFVLVWYL
jgi:hypothetical protein